MIQPQLFCPMYIRHFCICEKCRCLPRVKHSYSYNHLGFYIYIHFCRLLRNEEFDEQLHVTNVECRHRIVNAVVPLEIETETPE